MKRFIAIAKFIFRFIIPFCLIPVFIFRYLSLPESGVLSPHLYVYFDMAYKILLSSMVGYFTNFLAIIMLFKPKNKTRHGIQGLIPRNQDSIADRLGSGIADNFFNPKDMIDYIKRNDLIADSISSLSKYTEDKLEMQENQKKITDWILNQFQSNSHRLFYVLAQLSEMNLSKHLRERIDLDSMAKEVTGFIEKSVNDGTINLKAISRELTLMIQDNIPQISGFIYRQIAKTIEQQGTIKKNILKLATWTFDFDQSTIEENLYETVQSYEFRSQLYDYLEQASGRLTDYLDSEEGIQDLNRYYQKLVVELNERVRSKGVGYILSEIEKFLQRETSWVKIKTAVKKGLAIIQELLEDLVANERFDQWMNRSVPVILEKIKVSSIVSDKVKVYDTDNLEKMVKDASGEHLAAIEVLGGILGGFVGIALFSPLLFIYIVTPIGLLGLVEYIMTKRQQP